MKNLHEIIESLLDPNYDVKLSCLPEIFRKYNISMDDCTSTRGTLGKSKYMDFKKILKAIQNQKELPFPAADKRIREGESGIVAMIEEEPTHNMRDDVDIEHTKLYIFNPGPEWHNVIRNTTLRGESAIHTTTVLQLDFNMCKNKPVYTSIVRRCGTDMYVFLKNNRKYYDTKI